MIERVQPATSLPKTKKVQQLIFLVTQSGSDVPTVEIVKNDFGTIFGNAIRTQAGYYTLHFAPWTILEDIAIPKPYMVTTEPQLNSLVQVGLLGTGSSDEVQIMTHGFVGMPATLNLVDGQLNRHTISISRINE